MDAAKASASRPPLLRPPFSIFAYRPSLIASQLLEIDSTHSQQTTKYFLIASFSAIFHASPPPRTKNPPWQRQSCLCTFGLAQMDIAEAAPCERLGKSEFAITRRGKEEFQPLKYRFCSCNEALPAGTSRGLPFHAPARLHFRSTRHFTSALRFLAARVTMSTWPSNQMNGISTTTSADLPWNSRYVGTTSGTMMTQNAAFLPMTNNPNALASPNGALWSSTLALPAQSLGGDINTLLSNNVLTTKITPELTSKLTYRYYDFDNQTPRIIFPQWVAYDGTGSSVEKAISSLSISYIKQNAGEELNWRPTREWNFNLAGGWEGYNYSQADAGYTNEYSVKGSVDWKPFGWLTARASGSYGDRIAGNYSYLNNVADIQYPIYPTNSQCTTITASCGSWLYSSAYQQFMFDNRQRTAANFLLDVVVFPGVTITPTFKYKDDYYPLNTANTPATAIAEGVSDQKMISGGVDVAWVITPSLSIVASYYYEYYHQQLYSSTTNAAPTAATLVTTIDNEFVNTVTVAAKWAAIPNTLDFDVRGQVSGGVDQQTCNLCTWTNAAGVTQPAGTPFPNDTTLWERVDATATYRFDPTWVHQMGFKGDILARLRYTWERNAVNNWQNDSLAAFTDIPAYQASNIYMAYDNPNYNVQMLALSLMARW